MKFTNNILISSLIAIFGVLSYLLERFMEPVFGKTWCEVTSAIILLLLTLIYLWISAKEKDERERALRQQVDSISLYILILGLLGATIFDHQISMENLFWIALGLIAGGRISASIYQRIIPNQEVV